MSRGMIGLSTSCSSIGRNGSVLKDVMPYTALKQVSVHICMHTTKVLQVTT